MVKKRNKKSLFCYCHFGGELNVNEEKSVSYKGGSVDGVVVNEGTKYDAFVDMICEQLSITPTGKLFQYSVKFDRSCLLPLKDQNALDRLLQFNDDAGYVYVVEAKEAANPVVATTRSSGTKRQLVADVNADIDYADRDVVGFSNTDNDNDSSADQCANGDEPQLEGCSSTEKSPLMYDDCEKQLTGLGQIFHNAKDFRLAVYKYSVVKRFKYKYVKNSTKVIRVRCGANTCPWRVAATCIGNSGLLRVNKFIEKHDHEGLDGDFSQLYNAKMVSQLLKEKLKSSQDDLSSEILKVNRDDLSSQISNDIFRDISVQLTYSQSYQLKKRLKVAIHGKTGRYIQVNSLDVSIFNAFNAGDSCRMVID
ncbi:Protein FAR1-RELATED SEQUENCE like [Quillaja saponaria]|uniref:Protein FAR1-RELATED SEQUENCE like n=1 Tax=Quillaja saponaria TaxID=32244 RepID=A0AAD7VIL9_QUISA|nr:Protein FAR1-RELATED SEQUENCE like [Quillaja saponaria]